MQTQGSANKEKFVVALLKEGSEDAFDSLFREYSKRLYHFGYGYLKSREEAEEVVQETFIRVWEARATIDPDYSFGSFIFTIAYRLVLNRLRKIRNDQAGKILWQQNSIRISNDTEDNVVYENLRHFAKAVISELPPKRKIIYRLVKEDHLTYQQVADRLNISVKTVEAQMSEALRFLRKRITLHTFLPITTILFL